jgi:protein SCO1
VSTRAPHDPPSSQDAATVPPADEADTTSAARGRRGWLLPAVVALVILAGLTVLVVGGSSKPSLPSGVSSSRGGGFDGSVLSPRKPAPPLARLRNYQGQPVNLARYRGKVVFVTFLYTHCPDACPLIAASLHTALGELGSRARQVQLIAVSVDPRGDTPSSVAAFLKEHGLLGQMQYLIGSAKELAPVWSEWHVGSAQDANNPELVNHTAIVYGVSASGKLTTIYPAGFSPGQIVHDFSGLLAS